MQCRNCGAELDEGTNYCPVCGAEVNQGQATLNSDIRFNLNKDTQNPRERVIHTQSSGEYYDPNADMPAYGCDGREIVDSDSLGWSVLGFFLPMVGLTLYFIWNEIKPKAAKRSVTGAIVGIISGVILGILAVVILFAAIIGLAGAMGRV